jgi:hypothetical protein
VFSNTDIIMLQPVRQSFFVLILTNLSAAYILPSVLLIIYLFSSMYLCHLYLSA